MEWRQLDTIDAREKPVCAILFHYGVRYRGGETGAVWRGGLSGPEPVPALSHFERHLDMEWRYLAAVVQQQPAIISGPFRHGIRRRQSGPASFRRTKPGAPRCHY